MSHDAVDLLQALIRNQCVNDGTPESGFESRSVQTLVGYLGVEGEVFEPAPGRQSVVYRVPGTDPSAPSLALVPHLDVVPVDTAGWSVDPFAAGIADGLVFGRGAVDMLNVTAAMTVAVRPYLTGEKKPGGDLVLCAVADEENGGRLGAMPLVNEHWDKVRADYLLTEVAYPGLSVDGHKAVPVSIGEKGAYWSVLKTAGSPGHGSLPYGTDNALDKMVTALAGIIQTPVPAAITEEWISFVRNLGLDEKSARRLTDVDRLDDEIDRIAVSDPALARYIHAATHLTISTNTLRAGTKTNVVADRAHAEVDIRGLPGMDREFVDSHLRKAMGSSAGNVEILPIMDGDATVSPVGNPLWEAIGDAVEDLDGHRHLAPTLMTVATDARFWRARGTVCYGVGLFDDRMTFSEMLTLFHGHDERVSVESVERTTALYERVLDRFFAPA
ncbi:MAG TPA: M20/M25/M40 family metallo-hydrolase [Acidimicrobiia bacterium]|nr:M20/M25/M40 family metallo-hydrolase [Acidimicrobiia bacterium]